MISVPHVPRLQVAVWATIGGIAIITMSRNVPLKRVIVPITFLLFSYVWLESVRVAFDPPVVVLGLLAIPLTVNGLRVAGQIKYCPRCGHTLDNPRRRICKECKALLAKAHPAR